ncbi:MAG: pyroglutamyl-peptidase I [Pirellulaceae bacterium]
MTRVLVTAFGPYNHWPENSSWLALVELTRHLPSVPEITTRLYPVDLAVVTERLAQDLPGQDYVIHLGQAPGATSVQLEAIGINVGAASLQDLDQPQPLVPDGPIAYQSQLPLAVWAGRLRDAGIPACVSYHAGTYLCNATLYLTHFLCERNGWPTRATFVHLPLSVSQAIHNANGEQLPSMPSTTAADALRLILEELVD